jgi:hypothetical protein
MPVGLNQVLKEIAAPLARMGAGWRNVLHERGEDGVKKTGAEYDDSPDLAVRHDRFRAIADREGGNAAVQHRLHTSTRSQ